MEQLVCEAADYLNEKQNADYLEYTLTAINELFNQQVSEKIKKEVLAKINLLLKSNRKIRFYWLPTGKLMIKSDFIKPFENYYIEEKKALINMKKLLNSKKANANNIPINSYCGVIVTSIVSSHLENIDKVSKFAKSHSKFRYSGYHITFPEKMTIPENTEFVKKLGSALSRQLTSQNKKNS